MDTPLAMGTRALREIHTAIVQEPGCVFITPRIPLRHFHLLMRIVDEETRKPGIVLGYCNKEAYEEIYPPTEPGCVMPHRLVVLDKDAFIDAFYAPLNPTQPLHPSHPYVMAIYIDKRKDVEQAAILYNRACAERSDRGREITLLLACSSITTSSLEGAVRDFFPAIQRRSIIFGTHNVAAF